jgi:hypothetical protein
MLERIRRLGLDVDLLMRDQSLDSGHGGRA